jgi:uroporphyrinogen decarboxylase
MDISFWKHHPVSDQYGHLLAQEAIEFQNEFQFDFLKITPAGDWLAVCYGAEDEVWENDPIGRRKITSFPVKEIKDFYNLKTFTFQENLLLEILKAQQICSSQVEVPVYSTIFCPLSQLIQISGLELFLKAAKTEPEAIYAALKIINENTQKVIEQSALSGVKGLYYVAQHMQSDLLTFDIYNQFGKSSDYDCLNVASKVFDSIIFHLHGDDCYACISENIPKLRLHCSYNQVETTNSIAMKKIGYPIIYGLPATTLLEASTIEDCQEILKKFPTNTTLTCDCVIPLDFPAEKISLWTKFAHEI